METFFRQYEQNDGTILGDPLNVKLTKDIIELGWNPPVFRTKWDLLPIVTMAEDDIPAITELPKNLFPLVNITHPKFSLAFDKLGLKWVPAPALSRLGFDVGGVQYTATPFVGWFMDAEIGVRDLADQQRYNALPSLVECLGWVGSIEELDEVQESEKLRLLHSNVRISDTLTASAMYCSFDDEHFRKFGFRLPADPYWLAPPQGSIIPLWHRGGSPNYQPKPLIARHVQDPIKHWKRRTQRKLGFQEEVCPPSSINSTLPEEKKRRIYICYCSAGVTALKLARRAEFCLKRRLGDSQQFSVATVEPLNSLYLQKLTSTDVILLIVSSSGHGDIPTNGQEFARSLEKANMSAGFRCAIFGNGDSTYSDSYNGAAKKLNGLLIDQEVQFLVPDYFKGDTALENPPWSQLETWLNDVSMSLVGSSPESLDFNTSDPSPENFTFIETFSDASIVSCTLLSPNIRRLVLNIGNAKYTGFSHVQVMTPNRKTDVKKVLKDLGLAGNEKVKIQSYQGTVREILEHFVDLQRPFTHVRWVPRYLISKEEKETLLHAPLIKSAAVIRNCRRSILDPSTICAALPLGRPRNFSIASSDTNKNGGVSLEFLIKSQPQGRFSSIFLSSAKPKTTLRIRFTGTAIAPMVQDASKSIIAFTTGSGIAPLKYVLQQRTRQVLGCSTTANNGSLGSSPISLFVGFRADDARVISNALQGAIASSLVDTLSLTPSNPSKWRAQDDVFDAKFRDLLISKIKESCYVFVCVPPRAAKSFASNLSALLGTDVKKALGDMYIEEVFQAA
ncbi:hypothetical protein N0V90_004026 [Kalmusia sp. IMI 367209]|nr:hypothetical protein N0V90_004026 [Kalmusia sp. IMI 367209]